MVSLTAIVHFRLDSMMYSTFIKYSLCLPHKKAHIRESEELLTAEDQDTRCRQHMH